MSTVHRLDLQDLGIDLRWPQLGPVGIFFLLGDVLVCLDAAEVEPELQGNLLKKIMFYQVD